MHLSPQSIQFIITAIVIGIVMTLRLRGLKRARRLRLETLWIVPVIYLIVVIGMFWRFPPHGLQWAYVIAAIGLGAALGWRRGALMRISVDPETHALNQQSSPAALLFIVLLIVVRMGLRYEARSWGFDVMALTDILMAFALGLFTATRAEMFLRARRLLAAARAL